MNDNDNDDDDDDDDDFCHARDSRHNHVHDKRWREWHLKVTIVHYLGHLTSWQWFQHFTYFKRF